MPKMLAVIATATLVCLPTAARPSTTVTGVTPTATWTLAGSPYRVTGTVTVPAGDTLTIEPGVDVLFDADAPFVIHGRLAAVGTESDSIMFEAGAAPEWGGLRISGGDTSRIQFARIGGGNAEGSVSGSVGGGVGISGAGTRFEISDVTIESCSASSGGAVAITDGASASITRCAMLANVARSGGGAIYSRTTGTVALTACTIRGNLAHRGGGGITAFPDGTILVERTEITGNTTYLGGGAIRVEPGGESVLLANCTLARNVAYAPGGAILSGAHTEVSGCIVWENSPDQLAGGGAVEVVYSIVQDGWDGAGNINVAPLFADPNNGDFSVLAGSPCIDTGSPYAQDEDGSRSDMGHTGGGGPDPAIPRIDLSTSTLAVYSGQPEVLVVSNSGWADLVVLQFDLPPQFSSVTAVPRTIAPGDSLVISIVFSGDDEVTGLEGFMHHTDGNLPALRLAMAGVPGMSVSSSVSGTWRAASGPYRVSGPISIEEGAIVTIEAGVDVLFDENVSLVVVGSIHAYGTETDSVRFLPGKSEQWGGLHLLGSDSSSLTYARISGGVTDPKYDNGGGIKIESGARLAMDHSVISRNTAIRFGDGGGIRAGDESRLFLTDCMIANNRAGEGAGVLVCNRAEGTFTRCWFVSNSPATDSSRQRGGGLSVQCGARADLFQCVFYRNRSVDGAAIYAEAELVVTNCTIVENVSDDHVADIDIDSRASVTVTNTIFSANAGKSISQHGCAENLAISYSSFRRTPVCDHPGSLQADPAFVANDGNPFALGPGSPCIDAGSPYMLDEDGTRADMGATGGGGPNPLIPRFEMGLARLTLSQGQTGLLDIWNSGWADMEVSLSALPEAFSTSMSFPQTVAPSTHLYIPITFSGAEDVLASCSITHSDTHQPGAVDVQLYGLQGTVVYGFVRGTWTQEGSPYRVVEPVTVAASDTLTIEPGVDVLFDRNVGIVSVGDLHAVGTPGDSIRFLSGASDSWTGIALGGTSHDDSSRCELRYVRISGGSAGVTSPGWGRSTLSMARSVISGVQGGSPVYMGGAQDVLLDSCRIVNNETTGDGGGILIRGNPSPGGASPRVIVKRCTIANNRAGAAGGGLCVHVGVTRGGRLPQVTLSGSIVSHNRAEGSGGGVYVEGAGEVLLDSCTISRNSAGGGGGILIARSEPYRFINAQPSVAVTNCSIDSNSVDGASGSGMHVTTGGITVSNTTITRNNAPDGGFAVGIDTNSGEPVELTNCTVADNECAGVYSPSGGLLLSSCILWNNQSPEISFAPTPDEPPIRPHGEYVPASINARYSDITNGWPDRGIIDADPLFVDAPAGNYRLRENSPCIDTGDPYFLEADSTRPDMGATGFPVSRRAIPRVEISEAMLVISTTQPVHLWAYNTGWADLEITGITFTEGFSTALTFPATVVPGDSIVIPLVFAGTQRANGTAAIATSDTYYAVTEVPLRGVGVTLTGEISGKLTKSRSPYTVLGDIVVPTDSTLVIEPGVDILFDADATFIVNGGIDAMGTEADSIRFVPGASDQWQGIRIATADSNTANVLSYVRISGVIGRSGSKSGPLVVANKYDGVPALHMDHSVISGNSGFYGGVALRDTRGSTLSNCTITRNTGTVRGGLTLFRARNVDISDCVITDNTALEGGGLALEDADASLTRCVIARNTATSEGGGIRTWSDVNMTLDRCTIVANAAPGLGVGILARYSTVTATNCIIRLNGVSDTRITPQGLSSYFMHLTHTNSRDATWEPTNIDADPLFVDAENGDYHLLPGSPCVDAGDPDSPSDPDGTRADMGAFPLSQGVGIAMRPKPARTDLTGNFPNPFNPNTSIRYALAEEGEVSMVIHNILGQPVRTLLNRSVPVGYHSVVWDGRDDAGKSPASGVYLVRMATGNYLETRRILLLK